MGKSEHIPGSRIERFCISALPEEELVAIARHLAQCTTCHTTFTTILRRQRGSESVSFNLPEFWLRHEHLDYEQIAALADNRLDATDREIIDAHLATCGSCREDVSEFLAFRKQIEPELSIRYGPATDKPREVPLAARHGLRQLVWKPAYVVTLIVIAIGLLVAVLYTRRKTGNLEARQTPPSQVNRAATTPTPESHVANRLPSPAPSASDQLPQRAPSQASVIRNRENLRTPENTGTIAVLNDGRGIVTVDKAGNVSGLDQISQDTRREIAEAVKSENINKPETVTELAGATIILRGTDKEPTFKLRSPARTVILSDRPSFQWEPLSGATSYRVSVGDLNGHEVTRSDQLSSDRTIWIPSSPLRRGEIYVWEVEATVDGKKVVSPGTSETQMKFKVLSDQNARELEQLKKTNSHLGLGVFYAREGMLIEAEREFQILIHDNPKSTVLRQLLKQIQSWSRH